MLLFYLALSGVWTFMASISIGAGNDEGATSIALAVATGAGIASALIATALGDTPRQNMVLAGGYVAMALSVALLLGTPALIQFSIAAIIFKFAWTLILPYLLSTLSTLGTGGQVMNTVNLMIGSGFALGPILAGYLIDAGGFGPMLIFFIVCVLASLACVTLASRLQGATLHRRTLLPADPADTTSTTADSDRTTTGDRP